VRVLCPMTIGGSFEARTTSLAGELKLASPGPVSLSGELSVDLTSLDTGIGLRNEHMHDHYLEVGRGSGYDHAVLSAIGLGRIDPAAFQGRTAFTGTLLVHGTKRPISGQATIRREGRLVRVTASFPVSIADFGIPKPQYLGVGVRNEVSVSVSLVAEPEGGSGR
jgi:polyisoprenoid-binding protein YceI